VSSQPRSGREVPPFPQLVLLVLSGSRQKENIHRLDSVLIRSKEELSAQKIYPKYISAITKLNQLGPLAISPPTSFASLRCSLCLPLLVRLPSLSLPTTLPLTSLPLLVYTVSPAEASFFPSLFTKFQENGTITGQSAFNLLPLSDVPLPTLGEIWGLADPEDKGVLDVAGWTVAMRLISVAQKGGDISREAGEQGESSFFLSFCFLSSFCARITGREARVR